MIPILYEEPHFMLVNKPAGILTQAVPGIDSLQIQLIEQLRTRDSQSGPPFVGLPHRLDRGTSGLLLIARNQRALKQFGAQFQSRLVQKYYVAWIEGRFAGPVETWRDYVRKVENQPIAEITPPDAQGARLAEMQVKSVANQDAYSLVLIRLLTGRMHQIRVQLAHRGFFVVGDELYKSNDTRRVPHALHALRLEFRHPTTAIQSFGSAPVPNELWNNASKPIQSACAELYQLSCQTQTPWELESIQ